MVNGNKLNDTFVNNKLFPFTLIKDGDGVISNTIGELQTDQWKSSIQDKDGKIIIKCKYNGYDPGEYWAKSELYN